MNILKYWTLYSFFQASKRSIEVLPSSMNGVSNLCDFANDSRAFIDRSVSLIAHRPRLVVGMRSSTRPSSSSIISSNIAVWPLTLRTHENKTTVTTGRRWEGTAKVTLAEPTEKQGQSWKFQQFLKSCLEARVCKPLEKIIATLKVLEASWIWPMFLENHLEMAVNLRLKSYSEN